VRGAAGGGCGARGIRACGSLVGAICTARAALVLDSSQDDYKLEVSSRRGHNEERMNTMKITDIVEMWNEISEDMFQAHQL